MKTKTLIKLFLSPIFIFSITSCGLLNINRNSSDEASSFSSEEKDSPTSSSKDSSMSSDSLVPDEIPNKEYDVDVVLNSSEGFEEFWNPHSSLYFNITMSQEAANFINDYQSNHDDSTYFDYYVPCTFSYTLNGVTPSWKKSVLDKRAICLERECLKMAIYH